MSESNGPKDIEKLINEEGLTLGSIRQLIPKIYFKPNACRSWFTFFRIFFLIASFIYLETKVTSLSLLILIWFMHGQAMVGLFVLAHDCGHRAFSRKGWVNSLVGHLSFSPLGTGLVSWKLTHDHHHAHTQLKGQEVDWSKRLLTKSEFEKTTWRNNFITRLGYALPFGVFVWVLWNALRRGVVKRDLMNRDLSPKEARAVALSNLTMMIVMLIIYGTLFSTSGLWGMLKYHAIPATIAMLTGYALLIIQHANPESIWFEKESWTPVKGQLAATFDVRFPRIFEWLWLDINIHIPHHVSPNIPWYHLRAASEAIKSERPELYQEREFKFGELGWMIRTPFIQHEAESKRYLFESFARNI